MKIIIKALDGKTVIVEVTKDDTILNIKKKIQEKMNLLPQEQKLMYQEGILENDKTVEVCNITEKSIIKIFPRLHGGMDIFAKTMEGNTVTFKISNRNKVSDIKKKIQKKMGLKTDEQILFYRGGILQDDKTVDQYQIVDQSTILVRLRGGIEIFVKIFEGKTATLAFEVFKGDKVSNLKKKIQEKMGMTPAEQNLAYQGLMLMDDKTFEESRILEKSVICLVPRLRGIQIFATIMDGNKVSLNVTKEDKVIDIKKMILRKMGMNPDEQILMFEGGIIDDHKTMHECNITDQSLLQIRSTKDDI